MNPSNQHAETFRQEVEELLVDIEEAVLDIESDAGDSESINRLFRAMHTIKGAGAMFGFDDIAGFTHHVETVLDRVREGEMPVTKDLIDLVLASRDQISLMLENSDGAGPADSIDATRIVNSLAALLPREEETPGAAGQGAAAGPASVDAAAEEEIDITFRIRIKPAPGIFGWGMDPALLIEDLRELGESRVTALMDKIPEFDLLDPESCYLYWDVVLTTTKGEDAIRDVFIFVEDGCEVRIEQIEGGMPDELLPRVGEILIDRGDVSREAVDKALGGQKRIGDLLVESGELSREKIDSALKEQEAVMKRKTAAGAASIRVPADKLDRLIDLVGELVTNQARLTSVAERISDTELASPVEEVERLTAELRDSVLNIRMMPIGTTFSRFRRLLRDLSAELGKKIELVTEGAETELDKTIIERLNDPLVHLIRNSIDHGIEPPAVREAAGKPSLGTIRLSAVHRGANVEITISDNGAGLDSRRIRQKAVERGLIGDGAELTENEVFALVFAPGFSTSQNVTSVSGRGVGMDVVKRAIEAIRGTIEITSNRGVGTVITLKLPLTLAIIEGLLVTIGKGYYILPLMAVEECVELSEDRKGDKKTRILNIRGEMVPYVCLRDHFGMEDEPPEMEHVIIADLGGTQCGFVVDSIIGNHQTVKKSLGPVFRNQRNISGASILGDGTVALILDVGTLI